MLFEAMKYLAELVRKGDRIELVHDDTLRKSFVRKGDEYEEKEWPPALRQSQIMGLEDFVAAVFSEDKNEVEVYHTHESIVLLLDAGGQRKETVTFALQQTPQFETLAKMAASPPSLNVRALQRMLRFDLFDCGPEVLSVAQAMAKLEFAKSSHSHQEHIERARDSMGKSAMAEVTGVDKIPDSFVAEVDLYAQPGVRELSHARIQCAVHIDMHDETVQLRPLTGEIDRVINAAQAALGVDLKERLQEFPVYYGRPFHFPGGHEPSAFRPH